MAIQHTDHTATQGFEEAGQNVIPIQPWQCPHCLRRFGEKDRKSGRVNVVTAKGLDHWCGECFDRGVKKGICMKYRKLDKKERRKLMKNPPECLNCGKPLIPVKDPMQGKFTGYLWRCVCMPKDLVLSIG